MCAMSFSHAYLEETVDIVRRIDAQAIDRMAAALSAVRDRGGRLFIIGALFDRMAPVLWVIAVLSNLTVIDRMIFTWHETKRLEEAQLRPAGARTTSKAN